jgi:glycosyltransferase involved in cell wall biosynthesis
MRVLHIGYGFRPWRHGGLIAYAEDVMAAQTRAGHEVTYFCRGRHYPGAPNDRLHRWERGGVQMRELLNSTLTFGGDSGTLTPEADVAHAPSEEAFIRVLEERRPEIVHMQEIIGLPSSLIDVAIAYGIPIIATLQDYFPLCPVIKLYDVDDQLCHRHEVGAQCARCCALAPDGRKMFVSMTVAYELRRALGRERGDRLVDAGQRLLRRGSPPGEGGPAAAASPPRAPANSASPLRYQARRDINVARLSRMDALVAQSRRVGEIYSELGVDPARVRVIHLTLRHLEGLRPHRLDGPPSPVRFVALNGAASRPKGADILIEAATALDRDGVAGDYTLELYGYTTSWARAALEELPHVRVHGGYGASEIDQVLDGYHVGIIPSVWEEAYGYVGPEFLSKGIPIIGNARGGIVDYTCDGTTGWVNRSADAEGLAAIMREIVAHPQQVVDRNAWILEHRDELIKSLDRHLTELEDLYGEVIAKAEERRGRLQEVAADSAGG